MNTDELINQYNKLSQFEKKEFLNEIIKIQGLDKIVEILVNQYGTNNIISILEDYAY